MSEQGKKILYPSFKNKYDLDISTIVLNDKKYNIDERDVSERFKKRHTG